LNFILYLTSPANCHLPTVLVLRMAQRDARFLAVSPASSAFIRAPVLRWLASVVDTNVRVKDFVGTGGAHEQCKTCSAARFVRLRARKVPAFRQSSSHQLSRCVWSPLELYEAQYAPSGKAGGFGRAPR